MKRIYKYPFEIVDGIFNIEMPKGAEILTVKTQFEKPCIWAVVETDNPPQDRHFVVHGTGHQMLTDFPLKYVGTFFLLNGTFVGHLFEVITC